MVHYLNIYIKFVNKKIFYDEGGDNINNVENKTIQGGPERKGLVVGGGLLKIYIKQPKHNTTRALD